MEMMKPTYELAYWPFWGLADVARMLLIHSGDDEFVPRGPGRQPTATPKSAAVQPKAVVSESLDYFPISTPYLDSNLLHAKQGKTKDNQEDGEKKVDKKEDGKKQVGKKDQKAK